MVVSAVGDDPLGKEILDNFKAKGLKGLIETVPYPTGTVQVGLDANGVPCYDIKEEVAWDNIPYTPQLDKLASETRAVCFGSLAKRSMVSRSTIDRFLDAMPDDDGVLKIFDINLRQNFYTKEILRDSLSKCNILKINDEELETVSSLFGCPDTGFKGKCCNLLAEYGLKMLILTCGVNGSYVSRRISRLSARREVRRVFELVLLYLWKFRKESWGALYCQLSDGWLHGVQHR